MKRQLLALAVLASYDTLEVEIGPNTLQSVTVTMRNAPDGK